LILGIKLSALDTEVDSALEKYVNPSRRIMGKINPRRRNHAMAFRA
jgi:hypothetical protein